MSVISPKLNRLVRDIGKGIMQRFGREFPNEEYIDEVARELKGRNLNHDEYVWDIARTFVRGDLADRAKHDPFKTNPETGLLEVSLFKPADFAKGVIRLGNGMNISMAHANARQWVVRTQHQQRAAEAAQQAALKTMAFLQTEPGVLLFEDPKLKTFEAMRQLHLWDLDEDIRETDTDDDEGEPEE